MANAICQNNKDLPDSMILGNLLFYSLSDMKISENDLTNIFTSAGVPTNYIRKISKADAFRRATSSVKNQNIFLPEPNGQVLKLKVEVDEVRSDEQGIKRIIGVKRVDELNEDISYDPVASIEFDRDTENVTQKIEPKYIVFKECQDLIDDICDKYIEWSKYHTKDTVRNLVNRVVNDTHPVSLTQSGLCKFIPKTHTDLLYYLKDAITELRAFGVNGSAENYMEIIPIIDTEEQRELIKKASETELKDNLFSFTQELRLVLQNRSTLPARTVNSYLAKFKTLKEQVEDYEGLLGNYLGFLRTQIAETVNLINDSSEEDEEDE